MAREHHCPNCGPQACNASTSKIHTCGVCAAIWEEDISVPVPSPGPLAAPAAPKPAAPAPPRPAAATPTSAPSPSPAAKPAAPPTSPPPAPSAPPQPPAPPRPSAPAPPIAPSPPSPAAPPKPVSPPSTAGAKTVADALQGAKVKRCPGCQSDGVAEPSDFQIVQGRLVLVDSQTYRAHRWYADTGELIPAAAPAPAPPAARASPAT